MYFSKAVTSTHPGGGGYPQKDPGIRPLRAKVSGIRPYVVPGTARFLELRLLEYGQNRCNDPERCDGQHSV